MNEMLNKIIKFLDRYLFYTIVFLYPLFFLPIFPNFFVTAKLLLLVSGVLLLAFVKIIKSLIGNNFKLSTSKVDIFVVIFSIIYFISGLAASPDKMMSFFLPGAATFVIFSSILYLFAIQLQEKERGNVEFIIVLSTLIAACVQTSSFAGLIQNNFSTFGNHITSLVYYLAVLPIAFYKVFKKDKLYKNIFFGISSFIILIGIFTSFYSILPGKESSLSLPGLPVSWSVAVDSIKNTPLIGSGPSNYLESYNKLRPITANANTNWATKFLVSQNTPLTILTEVGLLGLVVFFLIFYISLKKLNLNSPSYVSLFVILIVSFLLPIPFSVFPLIMLIVALNTKTHESFGNFNTKIPVIIATLPFVLAIIVTSFYTYKAFWGEYNFYKSIKSATSGDILSAYNQINKTIRINPYVDRYHLISSTINKTIAESLAKVENLSDQDKETLISLIQQAVQESKAAVSLNPRSASSWESLGDMYNSIISFATDANKFAVESYSQAIFLDPINPNLRIKLGGVYYANGQFADAAKVFELAVLAKADLANAHYNLAMAYKENKELDKAKEQMNITLSLVGKDSSDFEIAKKELETIEGLTTPEATTDKPIIEPSIEVPSTDISEIEFPTE